MAYSGGRVLLVLHGERKATGKDARSVKITWSGALTGTFFKSNNRKGKPGDEVE